MAIVEEWHYGKRRLFRAAKGGQVLLFNSYVQGYMSSGGVCSGTAEVVVLCIYIDVWGKSTRTEGHLSLLPLGVR